MHRSNLLSFFTGFEMALEDLDRAASIEANKRYVELFVAGRLF